MIGAIAGEQKDPYCFAHQLSEIYGLEQERAGRVHLFVICRRRHSYSTLPAAKNLLKA